MKTKFDTEMIDEKDLDKNIESGDISPVHIPQFVTISDIIKFNFCSEIIRYKKVNKLKQKDIAEIININKSEVSKLFAYNLKEFSQERLLGFSEVLISSGTDINLEKIWNKVKKQSEKLKEKIKNKKGKLSKHRTTLQA